MRLLLHIMFLAVIMSFVGCKLEYDTKQPTATTPTEKAQSSDSQSNSQSDSKKDEPIGDLKTPVTPVPCPDQKCTLKKVEATIGHVVDPEIIIGYSLDDLEYERVTLDHFTDNISYSRFFYDVMSKESPINQLELTDDIYRQYVPYLQFFAKNQFELTYMLVSLVNSFPESIQNHAPEGTYLYPADSYIYGVKTDFQRFLLLMDMLSYYGVWHSMGQEDGSYTLGIPLDQTELEPHLLFKKDLGLVENTMRSYLYPHKDTYNIFSGMYVPVNTANQNPRENIQLEVISDFTQSGKQILNTAPTDLKKLEKLYQSNIAIIRVKDHKLIIDPILHNPSKGFIVGDDQRPDRVR